MGDDDVIVDGDQPRHGHHREAETCTDQDRKIAPILEIRPAAGNMCGEVLTSTISVCTNHIDRYRKPHDWRTEYVT